MLYGLLSSKTYGAHVYLQLSADLYEEEEFFASTFDLDLSGGLAKHQNSKKSSEKAKHKVTCD